MRDRPSDFPLLPNPQIYLGKDATTAWRLVRELHFQGRMSHSEGMLILTGLAREAEARRVTPATEAPAPPQGS